MIERDGRVVTFHFTRVEADEVFLVGDFNNWNERSHLMVKEGDRHWVLKMDLPSLDKAQPLSYYPPHYPPNPSALSLLNCCEASVEGILSQGICSRRQWLIFLGALTLIYAFCTLLHLGGPFIYDDGEAWYSVAVREMGAENNWSLPRFQGLPISKPPLAFWLMRLSTLVFGESELTFRLPSALFGLGGVLLTFAWGSQLFHLRTGLLAGLILTTSFQYFWLSRKAQLDMPYTFFIVAALIAFSLAVQKGRPRLLLSTGAFMALAAMIKGLGGVLLPVAVITPFVLFRRAWRILVRWEALGAFLLFAALTIPYYALLDRSFVASFFLRDHLERFLTGVDVVRPFYWYLGVLPNAFFPWSLCLPLAFSFLRSKKAEEELSFPLFWFSAWFLIISASAGKQEHYFLPLLPPLALVTARALERSAEAARSPGLRLTLMAVALEVPLAVLGYAIFLGRQGALDMRTFAAFALLIGTSGAVLFSLRRAGPERSLFSILGLSVLTFFILAVFGLPPLERAKSVEPVVEEIRSVVGGHPLVAFGHTYIPTPRVTYYLNPPKPIIRYTTEEALERFLARRQDEYLIMTPDMLEGLREENRSRLGRLAGRIEHPHHRYILFAPSRGGRAEGGAPKLGVARFLEEPCRGGALSLR